MLLILYGSVMRTYKFFIILFLSLFSNLILANHFYVGGSLGILVDHDNELSVAKTPLVHFSINDGHGNSATGDIQANIFASPSYNSAVASRLFAGYQYNIWLGAEVGLIQFTGLTWDVEKTVDGIRDGESSGHKEIFPKTYGDIQKKFSLTAYGLDLLATTTWNINQQWKLFGKWGLTLIQAKYNRPALGYYSFKNTSKIYILPEFILGAGYQLNLHWEIFVTLSTILGKGNAKSLITDTNDDNAIPKTTGDVDYFPTLQSTNLGVVYHF